MLRFDAALEHHDNATPLQSNYTKCTTSTTYLLSPGLLRLRDDRLIGVAHHGDKHVNHDNRHGDHVEEEEQLDKYLEVHLRKFLVLQRRW